MLAVSASAVGSTTLPQIKPLKLPLSEPEMSHTSLLPEVGFLRKKLSPSEAEIIYPIHQKADVHYFVCIFRKIVSHHVSLEVFIYHKLVMVTVIFHRVIYTLHLSGDLCLLVYFPFIAALALQSSSSNLECTHCMPVDNFSLSCSQPEKSRVQFSPHLENQQDSCPFCRCRVPEISLGLYHLFTLCTKGEGVQSYPGLTS